MTPLLKLGVFLLLAVIGYWRGSRNERAHLKWLTTEEKRLADVLVFATRYPPHFNRVMDPVLVSGSVVIGSDFFRMLIAALRKVVGGNYRSYEKLMDRGRRHALIKLKEQARKRGARMVFNVRYVGTGVANMRRRELAQMEIIAYGTAWVSAAGSVAQSRVHYQPNPRITADDGQTDLMKNPVSRWWVWGWFIGVFYCLGETVTDKFWARAWRYVGGAPWWLYGALSLAAAGWLVYSGRRHKLGWGVNIFLAVVTAPLLVFVLYFAALRVNGATAFDAAPTRYEVRNDHLLYPVSPASGKPVPRFDDYQDYWATQKPGTQVDIVVARGWLGFDQYDLNGLSQRFRAYYSSRPERHK